MQRRCGFTHGLFKGRQPWWRHQMETFSALLALSRGVYRPPVDNSHKSCWRGALAFLWSAPEQAVEQILETTVIWSAIALFMTVVISGTYNGEQFSDKQWFVHEVKSIPLNWCDQISWPPKLEDVILYIRLLKALTIHRNSTGIWNVLWLLAFSNFILNKSSIDLHMIITKLSSQNLWINVNITKIW